MAEIKEYIILAVCLCTLIGIISLILHSGLTKESNMALGAICLFALLSPAVGLIGAVPEMPDIDDIYIPVGLPGGYVEVSEMAFCEGICIAVADRLGCEPADAFVRTEGFSFENMRAECITVTLSGEAALADTRSLKPWLTDEFLTDGGICKVVIKLD